MSSIDIVKSLFSLNEAAEPEIALLCGVDEIPNYDATYLPVLAT